MPNHADTSAIARAQHAYSRQARDRLPSCGGGCILLKDNDTAEIFIIPITCKRWSCSYCAPNKLRLAQRKARAGHPERHIVLTIRPNPDRSQAQEITALRTWFRRLVTLCRKTFTHFEYMAALELHKSGTPHLHVLQRGTYISHRWLSRAWQRITGSYIVHIKQITHSRAAINELTKYLAKTACNLEALSPGKSPITTSNNWLIDKPDVDPEHLEHNFTSVHSFVHIEHLAEALERCGVELVADRGPPGRYHLDDLANATPEELETLRTQAYHEEDRALALAVCLLTDPSYIPHARIVASYHKDYPCAPPLGDTHTRYIPPESLAA